MLLQAYSVLTIKAVDKEQRTIEGWATTPTTDRVGDIVEPEGAEFKLPLPLLWQHDSGQPVGHVISAKVSKAGIWIKAKFATIDEEGLLRDRLEEAWQSVRVGLVRGLSIGFRSLEHSLIEDTYGYRYLRWSWLELSTVTIPANADASIQTIKAAFGRQTQAGVSATKHKEYKMKTLQEQLAELEKTREEKTTRMMDIMQVVGDEGRKSSPEEADEFDTLRAEVDDLNDQIRTKSVEVFNAQRAKPVGKASNQEEGSRARSGILSVKDNLPKGIAFAQYAKCVGLAKGDLFAAERVAKSLGNRIDPRISRILSKAAVPAGSTETGNWAANLVGDETAVFADFIEFLRPQTIIGRFGTGNIPSLRAVPFRVPLIAQTEGGAGYWVGEGKAKPLTNFNYSRTTLEPLKVANIAVVTQELLMSSSPSADASLRDQLVAALRERLDIDFVDPAKAAAAGVSPASISNGIVAIVATGTGTADNVRTDVKAIFGAFIAANNAPTSGVWIMPATVALALSLMVNTLGQPEFPGIGMMGGTFMGLPVITSEYVPTPSAGAYVLLVNAQDIYLADDGGFMIDVSREASLEMSDDPSHDSTTPTAAQLVSMFQTNSVAFKAERILNWMRRRTSAVAVLSAVNWGG
jgi:HK97 family phage prohead protease